MSALPSVSVVLPTRGRPALVREAVASVVAQDYAGPLDCVVVHDQESPDLSLEQVGTAERPVRVLSADPAGLAAARNTGIRATSGELVASCDDDDTWAPGKLRRQVERLRQEPGLLVVGAGIVLRLPGGVTRTWLGPSDVVTAGDLRRSRRKELHSSTLLVRRTAFEQVGGFDETLPHGYGEDWEWLLRAVVLGPVGVVREPLAVVAKDGDSWFRGRGDVVAEALAHLLRTHPELARSRRGHARVLGQIAFAEATAGRRRDAYRDAARALRRWPLAPQAALAVLQATAGGDPRRLLRLARLAGRGLA